MRLLHTTELKFKEFFDDAIPRYCILSHRWGDDEVSYHEFLNQQKRHSSGYAKIVAACEFASRRGIRAYLDPSLAQVYEWIWIDTCCIDKSSSSELSEAINSMYGWYQSAEICFVYLKDVRRGNDDDETMDMFRQSDWHTRGWTLQELLAPHSVCFLDERWIFLGTRQSLSSHISASTGISERHLRDRRSFQPDQSTVAEKMGWAAKRSTSRREDLAYCLLGLFDINMPLLYGEGERAFQRLQLEVLRSSDDESIFAWTANDQMRWSRRFGLLAPSPASFTVAHPDHADEFCRMQTWRPRDPYTVTNKGLELHVPANLAAADQLLFPLSCGHFRGGVYAIAMKSYDGAWERVLELDKGKTEGAKLVGPGLYIVDLSKLWNRTTLQASGSQVIYVRLNQRKPSAGW